MSRATYRHVTDEGILEIDETRARILIESRYQPSVHAVMMHDLQAGNRIEVRKGHIEVVQTLSAEAEA